MSNKDLPDINPDHHSLEHHKLPKLNLWQRWMAWSGSFLMMSILIHVLLFAGAAFLIVQVMQPRQKLTFTAPPPAPPSVEHSVKSTKKAAAAAPAVSKVITSTAANASIALPAMDLSSSTGPDVMASVMAGMGASGLGSGAAGGMASMPLTGLTAFGFRGTGKTDGLIGHLYDFKQTKDGRPTNIKDDGTWKNPNLLDGLTSVERNRYYYDAVDHLEKHDLFQDSLLNEAKLVQDFLTQGWDEKILQQYYKSPDPLVSYQMTIPDSTASDAVKAFGVEKQVKPTHFVILYKGNVVAPRDGIFRFITKCRGGSLVVNFDNDNVLAGVNDLVDKKPFKFINKYPNYRESGYFDGKWFHVEAGKKYPMRVFIQLGAGNFSCTLMIEEMNPAQPYLPSEWQWQTKQGSQYQNSETLKHPFILLRYPVFALRKGLPIPPFKIPSDAMTTHSEWTPTERAEWKLHGRHMPADPAPEPMVWSGTALK